MTAQQISVILFSNMAARLDVHAGKKRSGKTPWEAIGIVRQHVDGMIHTLHKRCKLQTSLLQLIEQITAT